MRKKLAGAALFVMVGSLPDLTAAPILFQANGTTAASIAAELDAFRAALGGLNPNTPASFESGRREINWDGVPEASSSPNAFPGDFFNGNVAGRARGVEFTTPGTGFEVSANSGAGLLFGNLNPQYPALFDPFSPNKLFTATGSNVMDVLFLLPTDQVTPATVIGFGAVFSDVDTPTSSTMEFFDGADASLGVFAVPAAELNKRFSFLGLYFNDGTRVGRVRITAGTASPGTEEGAGLDAVVMDDFIYGEPDGSAVPEPSTMLLISGAAGLLLWRSRRQRCA